VSTATMEIIGDRIKDIKARRDRPKHERPPRPEISLDDLDNLERLRDQVDANPDSPVAVDAYWNELDRCAKALLLDARELRKLREKLSRTIAKSNRRRNQLRQTNKTVSLYAASLHNLRRNSVDSIRDGISQQRHILDLKDQLRQERSERRRAEDELYRIRQYALQQPPTP
jgi:chromosome segregation ATPase